MTSLHRSLLLFACAGVFLTVGSCDTEPLGPLPGDRKSETDLTFLRFDPAFFSQIPQQASFWATRGSDSRLILRAQPGGDDDSGEKFLELKLNAKSLLRRPDGSAFSEGDSVLITVTLDPSARFLFDFQPSGLEFDPDEPAELRLRYVLASQDLNDDGAVDDKDLEFERLLAIWKREQPGDPWVRLLSLEVEQDELEADLAGFTGFALAN